LEAGTRRIDELFSAKAEELSLFGQPAGSRGVRRINVLAVSCGGFRPLMMAVVMSNSPVSDRLDKSVKAHHRDRKKIHVTRGVLAWEDY
jgi:hypothetical protein